MNSEENDVGYDEAKAKVEAAELRKQALELMRKADALHSDLPNVNELWETHLKLQRSDSPMRGEFISQGIQLAWAGFGFAIDELESHDGGTETEMYRCLTECATALMQADFNLKAGSIFYC